MARIKGNDHSKDAMKTTAGGQLSMIGAHESTGSPPNINMDHDACSSGQGGEGDDDDDTTSTDGGGITVVVDQLGLVSKNDNSATTQSSLEEFAPSTRSNSYHRHTVVPPTSCIHFSPPDDDHSLAASSIATTHFQIADLFVTSLYPSIQRTAEAEEQQEEEAPPTPHSSGKNVMMVSPPSSSSSSSTSTVTATARFVSVPKEKVLAPSTIVAPPAREWRRIIKWWAHDDGAAPSVETLWAAASFTITVVEDNRRIPHGKDKEASLLSSSSRAAAAESGSTSARLSDAAVSLQAIIRGALARWNFRVLKLQHKLASICALKEKQIKKIEQRKVQKMTAEKSKREFLEEHRIVRRRLIRVKVIRNRFAQEKVLALEENQQLRSKCRYLAQQNDGSAQILSSYIQSMDIAQQNVNASKATKAQLQETCRTYQTILDVFQQVAFS